MKQSARELLPSGSRQRISPDRARPLPRTASSIRQSEDGIVLIKFWFSISKEEQLRRFAVRGNNPLKQWKLSPIDGRAQELWDVYTKYKELMFSKTHSTFSPWIIVNANNKRKARLESIRYVLSMLDYDGKEAATVSLVPDPNIVNRFHRATHVD